MDHSQADTDWDFFLIEEQGESRVDTHSNRPFLQEKDYLMFDKDTFF